MPNVGISCRYSKQEVETVFPCSQQLLQMQGDDPCILEGRESKMNVVPDFEPITTTKIAITKIPFIIGVAGGTASGKSSVCSRIMEKLGKAHERRVVTISQDSFYRSLTDEETKRASRGNSISIIQLLDAVEYALMISVLHKMKKGESVIVPKYDFYTNSRSKDSDVIESADVIIVEGILILYDQELRNLFDMKLFVDADSDDRLARRVQRDTQERGRSLSQVLHQYLNLVKPAFEEFCLPTKKYADVIIPRGADNNVAIDLILHHIHEILRSPISSIESSSDEAVIAMSTAPSVVRDERCRACMSVEELMERARRLVGRVSLENGSQQSSTSQASSSSIKTKSMRTDCPVTIEKLGRSTWNLLHTIAAYYPLKPTFEEKKNARILIDVLGKTYPCSHCAEDLRRDLAKHPPDVEDREKFSLWMCGLHNRINKNLVNPNMTVQNGMSDG
ncbi:putative uridine-cytidine kinase [Dirofilaria immitis]|nr:putative uridine-cytidine kinase [Dirofilaria immitis]